MRAKTPTLIQQTAAVWRDGTLFFGFDIDSWPKFVVFGAAFSIVGALVVTALDPSNTSDLPFWKALLLWSSHMAFAVILMTLVVVTSVLMGLSPGWSNLMAVLSLPFLLAPLSLVVDRSLGVQDDDQLITTGFGAEYIEEVLSVAPSSLALSALVFAFVARAGRLSQALRAHLSQLKHPTPPLRDVLPGVPHRLGEDLVRLEAQDHYVLVVTTDGTATLSGSLSDCIDRLTAFDGAQCHRSHWIRYRHVVRLAKSGSAYQAVLKNEDTVPVSRRRYGEIRKHV